MASLVYTAGSRNDTSRIADLGSNWWAAKRVLGTTGADLTSGTDDWGALPVRESFELTPSYSENTITTEGKDEIVGSTTEKWDFKAVLLQNGAAELNAVPNALLNLYFFYVVECNDVAVNIDATNTLGVFIYAGFIGKMTQRPGIKNGNKPEYGIVVQKATANISLTLGDISADSATSAGYATTTFGALTLAISNGKYFGVTDVPAT